MSRVSYIKNTNFQDKIKILDTTLRDGEQTPTVALTPENKVEIAKKLDEFGVDIIEAGSAVVSTGEKKGLKAVAKEGLNAEISTYVRCLQVDIDAALDSDVDGIHLVIPTSKLHIHEKLKKTEEDVVDMARKMTEYAKDHDLVVELSSEDGSRTELGYLKQVYHAGVDAKADRLCMCDTVGLMTPEKIKAWYKDLTNEFKLPVAIHCHDDLGLATINTITALKYGAGEFHATVNGLGERCGNTSLEEVVTALDVLYNKKLDVKLDMISELSELVERTSGVYVPPNKAVVGKNSFTHEAGIHVHGLLANVKTYEPYPPELIGKKRKFVVGKHAGLTSMEATLDSLGIKTTKEQKKDILMRVKKIGDTGKIVTDADLNAIIDTVLQMPKKKFIEVEDLAVMSGNRITPTASVKLKFGEKERVTSGIGNGPVDAAINAISSLLKESDIKLTSYNVKAITGGTDAVVEVIVSVTDGKKTVSAQGIMTDIIMASVEALMNAINLLKAKGAKKNES